MLGFPPANNWSELPREAPYRAGEGGTFYNQRYSSQNLGDPESRTQGPEGAAKGDAGGGLPDPEGAAGMWVVGTLF